MPLMLESHDALPYIDKEPTAEERAAIEVLLASSAPPPSDSTTPTFHPSVPNLDFQPAFSQPLRTAHEHIQATGKPRPADTGIDLSRYEEPSAPSTTGDGTSHDAWRSTLRQAYTSASYLETRAINLSLLERYGKNAWLIANSQMEAEVSAAEKEVEAVNRELEELETARRDLQEGRRGEMEGLDETWRHTVGRAIEAEVAAEGLRRQILDVRRGATS